MKGIKEAIARIEGTPTSAAGWLAACVGVLFVRYLLENLSSPPVGGYLTADASTVVHYTLFFVSLALCLALVTAVAARRRVTALLRLLPYGLVLTLLAPLVDLAVSGGRGIAMAYLFDGPAGLLRDFFTFFGPLVAPGITPGIRIEVAIALAGIALYVWQATGSARRAAAAALVSYVAAFAWVSLPSLIAAAYGVTGGGAEVVAFFERHLAQAFVATAAMHPSVMLSSERAFAVAFNASMGQALFLALTALSAIAAWLIDARQARAHLSNSRPERVAHYFLLVALGIAVAPRVGTFGWADVLTLATLFLSFYFAWMFAVATNDLADVAIDEVSNRERPLIAGDVSGGGMRDAGLFFLVMSFVGAYLAGIHAFFLLGVFTAAYWTYSAPPLRLKRVPGLATFLIACACLSAAMAGFFTVSADKAFAAFPRGLAALLLIGFTVAANVKDVKDVEGDRRDGIPTVPTMLGERRGKLAVGAALALVFWSVPFFLGVPFVLLTSFPAGIVAFAVVNRRRYDERFVFATYFVFAAATWLLLRLLARA